MLNLPTEALPLLPMILTISQPLSPVHRNSFWTKKEPLGPETSSSLYSALNTTAPGSINNAWLSNLGLQNSLSSKA